MKPEEINRAILVARGYKLGGDHWQEVGGKMVNIDNPPDCHGSLDACAEFERTLDRIQRREYVRQLYHITENDFGAHCATAAQRCEAYLRMKELWNE
jgi:hypothetical protein